MEKEWEVGPKKSSVDCHIFDVEVYEKTNPNGIKGDYIRVKSPDWAIGIVHTSDDKYIMVNQFRHGTNENLTEFPCGCVEENESPMAAAIREAVEEVGLIEDKINQVTKLASYCSNPGFMSNKMHIFEIETSQKSGEFVSDKSKQDADEFIKVLALSSDSVFDTLEYSGNSIMMVHAWQCLQVHLMVSEKGE